MWSPTHPALFACVDLAGRLDLWNLNNDTEVHTDTHTNCSEKSRWRKTNFCLSGSDRQRVRGGWGSPQPRQMGSLWEGDRHWGLWGTRAGVRRGRGETSAPSPLSWSVFFFLIDLIPPCSSAANLRPKAGRVDPLRQDSGGDQRESWWSRRTGQRLMEPSSCTAAPNCTLHNSGFQLFHLLSPWVGLRRLAEVKGTKAGLVFLSILKF